MLTIRLRKHRDCRCKTACRCSLKERQRWYITGTGADGIRVRQSTGLGPGDEDSARAKLAAYSSRVVERSVWGIKRTTLFAEGVTHYVKQGGEVRHLEPLILRFGERRMNEISQSDVVEAAEALYPRTKPATRIRHVFVPMNAVYKQCAAAELCDWKVFIKPKVKKVPVRHATEDWFRAVLPHCTPHLAGILLFLTFTGARVSEACNLVREDWDQIKGVALLRKTKNGQPRQVTLPPVARDAVELALRKPSPRNRSGRVFGFATRWSVNTAIKRACAKAGVAYLSSHKIGRHAFAARLLAQGTSLKLVQEAGGWLSIKMVADNYGHLEQSHVAATVANVGTRLTHEMIGTETGNRRKPRKLRQTEVLDGAARED